MLNINSIDDVIAALEKIIVEAEKNNDVSGYFAVLYLKVTKKVKEGIETNQFEDGPRMEMLDVIFASRYLNAYQAWKKNEPVSASWKKTFESSTDFWPIVLQHLLMGMNAHINLDLGVAAAAVSKEKNIYALQNDFNKINEILSSLVNEVQNNLAEIWPTLKKILQKTRKVDDFLVDYSMQLSRDGAWKFATGIANKADAELPVLIEARDKKVAEKSKIIINSGFIARLIFGIIRISELGSVKQKIAKLQNKL